MLRQGRDATRMREIGTIHNALSMLRIDTPAAHLGLPNIIYVSIPDTSSTCANLTLPTPPSGWAYRCVPAASLRNINGTGWIPIDFTSVFQGSPLPSLPIDPTNTTASSNFYVYITDGRTWVLASLLESERHAPSAARDGGTDSARFEAGTNLALWTTASGLVGYWSFDEGAGTTARDLSGRGNTGTLVNNPTWVEGRVGRALSFDGVDDAVGVGIGINYFPLPRFTICNWIRTPGLASGMTANGFFSLTFGLIHRLNSAGQFVVGIDDGTTGHWPTAAPDNLHNNQWHYLCSAFDGVNLHMFINGIHRRPFTVTWQGTTRWPTNGVNIGIDNNNSAVWRFNGLIDEVRIHNRALTEAEIRASFNATR